MKRLLGALILGSMALPAASGMATGSDYYLSRSGDDAGSGTSARNAWKTLARASRAKLGPGDRLRLEGGTRFEGHLELGREVAGSSGDPVVVGSFGSGRATLDGGDGSAIVVDGSEWLVIRDVELVGSGRKSGNRQGVGIKLSRGRHLRVSGVESSGFQRAGIELDGCSDVRVETSYAHDNGFAGICSDNGRSSDIVISGCRAINNPGDPTRLKNHSGSGIVLLNVSRATIEYCEAAENGWDMPRAGNGPVGIWAAYQSDRVLIQHCISHDNKSPGLDGGGFDFDVGVTNSVMQFNYSYRNRSWGYLFYEYGSGSPFRNNAMRYCVSEDDGDAGIGVGVADKPYQVFSDVEIHNNVIVNVIGKPCVNLFQGNPSRFTFRNNVFVSKGGPQVIGSGRARFEANCYWQEGGGFSVDGHVSLKAWSEATGQEKLGPAFLGLNVDPSFDLSHLADIKDPSRLGSLARYRLREDSPLIDRGVAPASGLIPSLGCRDFFGHRVPVGAGFDIGLDERP